MTLAEPRAGGAQVTPLFAAKAAGSDAGAAARIAFLGAVSRLEQTLDLETEALEQHRQPDLREFNARKSHGLLELSRAMRAVDGHLPKGEAVRSLQGLRAKLERNAEVLKRHLQAVQEVSAMMSGAIQAAESDGTYSIGARRDSFV